MNRARTNSSSFISYLMVFLLLGIVDAGVEGRLLFY